jgi:hypothetical protein
MALQNYGSKTFTGRSKEEATLMFIIMCLILFEILEIIIFEDIHIIAIIFLFSLLIFSVFGFIYFIIKKTVIISEDKVEYFLGKHKRFEKPWNEIISIIIKVEKDDSISKIEFKNEEKDFGLHKSMIDRTILKEIFGQIEFIIKNYPNVSIERIHDKK